MGRLNAGWFWKSIDGEWSELSLLIDGDFCSGSLLLLLLLLLFVSLIVMFSFSIESGIIFSVIAIDLKKID